MQILIIYLGLVIIFLIRLIQNKNQQIIELTEKLDIYYNNYQQCLRALKENDPEEYKQLLKSKYLSKEHDYIIKYVAQDLRTSELTFIMSQMYDLAQAGLISSIYKDNEAVRFRHAQYLINLHACYYWNLRTTGSMFTFWNDNIKLFCNGLFEFYDWMKDNGTISN